MCRGNELPGTTGLLTSRCHQGNNACGEILALGLIKFPDFSLIWGIVLKFPDFLWFVALFPNFLTFPSLEKMKLILLYSGGLKLTRNSLI